MQAHKKTHKLWTAEEIALLKELWPTTSGGIIAEKLGRPIFSVYTKAGLLGLRGNGVGRTPDVQKQQRRDAWTPEHQALLERLYGKRPEEEIAQLTGHPVGTVQQMASRSGLTKEHPKSHNTSSYSVQHAAFHILNPDTAYVLGFILADGNLFGGQLQIGVTDREVVEYIRKVLKSNHPITVGRNTKSTKDVYSLRIREMSLYNSLIARGITPNKSLTATMPKVPDHLFWHFLRGYFDGDGTVYSGGSHGGLTVEFSSGSEVLLISMRDTVQRLSDIKTGTVARGRLSYYSANAARLGELMYRDSRFHLVRKRERFDDVYLHRNN